MLYPTLNNRVTQQYGQYGRQYISKSNPFGKHKGIDFGAINRGVSGDKILAFDSGVVIVADNGGSLGRHVMIKHANGLTSVYGHMTEYHVLVGQEVSIGQHIGDMGSTGMSNAPHLHFALKNGLGFYIDPNKYLKYTYMEFDERLKNVEEYISRQQNAMRAVRQREGDGQLFVDTAILQEGGAKLASEYWADSTAVAGFGSIPQISKEEARDKKYMKLKSARDLNKK